MQGLKSQGGDGLVKFEVLKPPVGSHPGATEAQGIKQPAAHWFEIKFRQLHVPAFVCPVADQPILQASAGDEALTRVSPPGAAAFAQCNRVVLQRSCIVIDGDAADLPVSEQTVHRGSPGFGEMQPEEGISDDHGSRGLTGRRSLWAAGCQIF